LEKLSDSAQRIGWAGQMFKRMTHQDKIERIQGEGSRLTRPVVNVPCYQLARVSGGHFADLNPGSFPPLILQCLQIATGTTTDIQDLSFSFPRQGMTPLQLSQCLVRP